MDDKLKNNRLSDDDLDKVNGGTLYYPATSLEAAMIRKGICPECYRRKRGKVSGILVGRGIFYTCTQCESNFYIKS